MLRFTIRDVLWLTVVVVSPALQLVAQERPDDISRSWWDVKESFASGKDSGVVEDHPAIGFWDGKVYFEDSSGVDAYAVTFRAADGGMRFVFRDSERVMGKGLLVKAETGAVRIFINHAKKRPRDVDEPKADVRSTMETFVCVPLSADEGRKRLAAHGVEISGK
jgi:hypothetical protein